MIEKLRAESKTPLEIYGVGGDKIKQTGAFLFFDLASFHVTGLTDAIKRYPKYRRAAKIILKNIEEVHPDLVVLIDNPGFNLHLAGKIQKLNIPIVYYIAPQVWAWAPKRIFKIKKLIRKVLVVFEFEKKIYEENGIPVSWVGHPLKDLIKDFSGPRESQNKKIAPVVSLLPGSRKGELKILFPIFIKAAELMTEKWPELSFNLIQAPTLPKESYQRLLGPSRIKINWITQDSYSAIRASSLAIVCSGTATLECALLGTPMIITNKGTWITYIVAKKLIRVPFLGLPNLVLGQKLIPELLQFDATPEKISQKALEILQNGSLQESMRKNLQEVSKRLGESGAVRRTAQEILKLL